MWKNSSVIRCHSSERHQYMVSNWRQRTCIYILPFQYFFWYVIPCSIFNSVSPEQSTETLLVRTEHQLCTIGAGHYSGLEVNEASSLETREGSKVDMKHYTMDQRPPTCLINLLCKKKVDSILFARTRWGDIVVCSYMHVNRYLFGYFRLL